MATMLTLDTQRGSRADLAALVVAMCYPSLLTWVYFVLLNGHPAQAQQVAYGVGKFLQLALPAAWLLVQTRGWPRFSRPNLSGLWLSWASGLAIFAFMLLGYYFFAEPTGLLDKVGPLIADKVQGFGISGPWGFLGMAVFYSVAHSLLEEYYWRWFVVGNLRTFLRPWPAILVGSLAFTAHHIIVLGYYFGLTSWTTWIFSLCVAFAGVVWAWTYVHTRSLMGPWLSHFFADVAIFWVAWTLLK